MDAKLPVAYLLLEIRLITRIFGGFPTKKTRFLRKKYEATRFK